MFFMVCIVIFLFYLYSTRNHDYWKKRGVKHEKPLPIFGNNIKQFFLQRSITEMITERYNKFPNERFVGYYRANKPCLVLRDPELIKQVMVVDFAYFYRRGLNQHKDAVEPLLKNLFFADGDLWKLLRQRMTPVFTSGKLKNMFPLIVQCAEKLQGIASGIVEKDGVYDVRELMARYTTDFIGACGFGVQMDSLNEENSEFRKLGKSLFIVTIRDAIVLLMKEVFPDLMKHVKSLGQEKEDALVDLVKLILKQRNYEPVGRNDFIDQMLELQKKGKIVGESIEYQNEDGSPKTVDLELDLMLIAAQVFVFFAAGFETSSSATSFTLHQLAFHPEEQKKVQAEIDRVLKKYDDKLTYEAVKEMTYLELAFKEAMRMFPSLGFLSRGCARKYTIPGTDITIDEGVAMIFPIQAIHNDEKYYENPSEFRPERFLPEACGLRHKFVYLPFGEGPRACIGERLGLMQSLAGLAALLHKVSVEPAASTLRLPRVDPRSGIVQGIKGGLPLRLVAR